MIRSHCVLLCLAVLIAWAGRDAAAECSVKTIAENNKIRIVLANPFVELTFDPARGGRCSSFRMLDNGDQLTENSPNAGMFLDHWAKYSWPSALMHLPYQHKIVGDGKTRVGVQLSLLVPASGGGKGDTSAGSSAKMPTSPELVGLVVRKTIWLTANCDAIEVVEELVNPTKQTRNAALYLQHGLRIGDSPLHDTWYMPSARGLMLNIQPDVEGGRSYGPDWVRDPIAGWMANIDRQTRRGLLFAFDYNYLDRMYTCGQSAEWLMDTASIAPGKSFTTCYAIKPIREFEGISFGSTAVMADLEFRESGKTVRVRHDIAAVSRPLTNLKLQLTVTGWRSKKVLASRDVTLPALGFERITHEFDISPDDLPSGVVIRVSVTGPGVSQSYQRYYAGEKNEHERRYGFFANAGGALGGTQGDAYFVPPPHKVKHFDKPNFTTVARPAADKFRCLVVFGLYTDMFQFDDALAGWKQKGRNVPQFTWTNCPPNAVESFPASYDELFSYNTIVLGDVNYKAIGYVGCEMLCDYVEQGGNLIVTGGPYALGNGEFDGTRFLKMLPVTISGSFDLKWAGPGKSWPLRPTVDAGALLAGVSFAENPKVFWQHFVTPKNTARVVLNAGDHPSLIVGRYGKGKIVVIPLSPTGETAVGEVAWWDWAGWRPLLKNVFSWLNDQQ